MALSRSSATVNVLAMTTSATLSMKVVLVTVSGFTAWEKVTVFFGEVRLFNLELGLLLHWVREGRRSNWWIAKPNAPDTIGE